MEYRIKDLFTALIQKWYVIVMIMVTVCGLSFILRNVSYQQVLRQYNELTSETYPQDSTVGSYTIVLEFSVPNEDDLIKIITHEDVVRKASVWGIDYTQAEANTSYATMTHVTQAQAEQVLFAYQDLLQAVAEEMYGDQAEIRHVNSLYSSYVGQPTRRAELAQTVMEDELVQPSFLSTLVKSALFSAALACFGILAYHLQKDMKKAEEDCADEP